MASAPPNSVGESVNRTSTGSQMPRSTADHRSLLTSFFIRYLHHFFAVKLMGIKIPVYIRPSKCEVFTALGRHKNWSVCGLNRIGLRQLNILNWKVRRLNLHNSSILLPLGVGRPFFCILGGQYAGELAWMVWAQDSLPSSDGLWNLESHPVLPFWS